METKKESNDMSLMWRIFTIFVLFLNSVALAGPKDPVEGRDFKALVESQDVEFQKHLETLFPETEGYLITGPLDPLMSKGIRGDKIFHAIRVVCPDLISLERAVDRARQTEGFDSVSVNPPSARTALPPGFRGAVAIAQRPSGEKTVQFCTVNQTRWLIWLRQILHEGIPSVKRAAFERYTLAVSNYMSAIDRGQLDAPEPKTIDFGLPQEFALYAPRPDYVIEGYQNYKDFLYDHSGITTEFARGIVAFVPTDSLLNVMKTDLPVRAFPNKEAPLLQYEYRKFFERRGDVRVLRTLTSEVFAALKPGEYFFAVGLSGKIRFGREFLREEVERLEKQTGKKVPRANHAFLFHGEPLKTAGAFFIEGEESPRLARVNAHSGHYFYSNVTATIRKDIAERSDEYLLTLGHFFRALDRQGIAYDSVLISKL